MPSPCPCRGCKAAYEAGYRDGYNDHVKSRSQLEAMYGSYTQHGKGENP